MINRDENRAAKSFAQLTQELLDTFVHVRWPYLTEEAGAMMINERDRKERHNNEQFFNTCVKVIEEQ